MLTVIAIANVAIALFCFMLSWRVAKFGHQITQLNRDLKHWTVLLENTLIQQTLAFTERRTDLRQWQLIHLQWQLQQRRLTQTAKFLRLVWLISKRRFP
ncbi:hypothetical protein N836_16460 [Leptolyngbya sp. Heron Island J]|uniref:hypothetical protein n=1 Tax=Leptolyngbya sp. Heron Island J TaxID=1385935 RepID=UPI0003B9EEA0|nr:hypothetical protein [Leptolyngbya sp. Heron Island J]ESA34487.1 hypothetical protein N836_16460 [Leptolyngbya sp. Heron Island J]